MVVRINKKGKTITIDNGTKESFQYDDLDYRDDELWVLKNKKSFMIIPYGCCITIFEDGEWYKQ